MLMTRKGSQVQVLYGPPLRATTRTLPLSIAIKDGGFDITVLTIQPLACPLAWSGEKRAARPVVVVSDRS